ncbi:antitoxin VbhA family protein, partial [Acinetobacter baumannii]
QGTKDHRAMHPAFWEMFQSKISGLPLLEGIAMTTTKAQRRQAHEQALASTRIEGHQPSPEFLADCEAVIEGTMTRDQARAASLARALA